MVILSDLTITSKKQGAPTGWERLATTEDLEAKKEFYAQLHLFIKPVVE